VISLAVELQAATLTALPALQLPQLSDTLIRKSL